MDSHLGAVEKPGGGPKEVWDKGSLLSPSPPPLLLLLPSYQEEGGGDWGRLSDGDRCWDNDWGILLFGSNGCCGSSDGGSCADQGPVVGLLVAIVGITTIVGANGSGRCDAVAGLLLLPTRLLLLRR